MEAPELLFLSGIKRGWRIERKEILSSSCIHVPGRVLVSSVCLYVHSRTGSYKCRNEACIVTSGLCVHTESGL